MQTIKTKDNHDVMLAFSDVNLPPGRTGQKVNTVCAWVNLGGDTWVRSPFRSFQQTKLAAERHTLAALWLHFHFKTDDLIKFLQLLGIKSRLRGIDY